MVEAKIPQARCDFYVYALLREDGSPFYVGKGRRRRCYAHLAVSDADRSPKARVIRRMLKSGQSVGVVKLASGLTEAGAFALEREAIARIGRRPVGPLWNLTDGGEGASGFKQSPETIAARLAVLSSPAMKEASAKKLKAFWADPDNRSALKETLKKLRATDEFRAAASGWAKARWANPEKRAAGVAALRSPEVREVHRQQAIEQWRNPERREIMLAAQRRPEVVAAQRNGCSSAWTEERRRAFRLEVSGRWDDPDYHTAVVLSLRRSWDDPVRRAAASERMKAMRARQKSAKQEAVV